MNSYAPPLKGTADSLAKHGRYGDSMLVHMNPIEVQGIASLVPGGRLPVNPVTGQPEAFAFLVPMLGGLLGKAALTGMTPALASAIGSGAATAIAERDLGKGLAAGIMGFGLGKVLGAVPGAAKPEAASTLGEYGVSASPESLARIAEHPEMFAATPGAREVLAAAQLPTQSGLEAMGQAVMDPSAILPIGVGGAELARLEAEEELEDYYSGKEMDRESRLAQTEEEANRAMRRRIYDYGLPSAGIMPRDPRYAAGGGLISLNPSAYAEKRQGLSRLAGEPVRMQSGGVAGSDPSGMQASLRGPFTISPAEMQQLYSSGYRPGIDPELEYFKHEPFQGGFLDPRDPNKPPPQVPELPGIFPPTPTPPPGGPITDPIFSGPRRPIRSDFPSSDEGGHIEYRDALREWEASQVAPPVSPPVMTPPMPPPPVSPPVVTPPSILDTAPVAPASLTVPSPIAPPPQAGPRPKRSDFGDEEGAEFRRELREWRESQAQRQVAAPSPYVPLPGGPQPLPTSESLPPAPPPVMQPPAPPPPPPPPPVRADYGYGNGPVANIPGFGEIFSLPAPSGTSRYVDASGKSLPKELTSEWGRGMHGELYLPDEYKTQRPAPPPTQMPITRPPDSPPPPVIERQTLPPGLTPRPGTSVAVAPTDVASTLAPVTSYLPEAPEAPASIIEPIPPSPTISPVQAFEPPEKPAMTLSELNALRPNRRDYDDEDRADYRYDLREWNELRKRVRGYQGGGITELVGGAPEAEMLADPAMAAPMDPAMMDPTAGIDPATVQLVEQTAMAVLGQVPQEQADAIIQAFIQQFGPEAFQMLRQQVLASVEPGAQTEGMIQGQGDGMSDEIMGSIGDQQRVAVSPGEYIVPADVVSGIGNGSSDAGAGELDRMMADIRRSRTGTTEQPPAINPRGAMPV